MEGPLESDSKGSESKSRCFVKERRSDSDALASVTLGDSAEKSLVEGEHDAEFGEKAPGDDAREAQAKAKGLTKSLQNAKKTESRLDGNIEKMKTQLKEQMNTQEVVAKEVEQIQKDLIIAQESLSVCESDVSSLNDELATIKKEIADSLDQGKRLADGIKALKDALDAAKAKKRELMSQKEAAEKDLSKVRSETEAKAKAVRRLHKLVKEAREAASKAEADMKAQIDQTRANADAEQNRVSELKRNLQSTQEEVSRLTEQRDHLHKFLDDSREAAHYLKPYNSLLSATSNTRQHNK